MYFYHLIVHYLLAYFAPESLAYFHRNNHNVAMHTWANVLKRKDIPISKISEGLGHRTEKMTRIYLENIKLSELDEINLQLIK